MRKFEQIGTGCYFKIANNGQISVNTYQKIVNQIGLEREYLILNTGNFFIEHFPKDNLDCIECTIDGELIMQFSSMEKGQWFIGKDNKTRSQKVPSFRGVNCIDYLDGILYPGLVNQDSYFKLCERPF